MTRLDLPGETDPGTEFTTQGSLEASSPVSSDDSGFGAGLEGGSTGTAQSSRAKKKKKKKTRKKSAEKTRAKSDPEEPSEKAEKKAQRKSTKKVQKKTTKKAQKKSAKKVQKKAKRTKKAGEAAAEKAAADAVEEGGEKPKRRKRRGTRGGRRRKRSGAGGVPVEVLPGEEEDLPTLPTDAELVESGAEAEAPAKKKRKRSRKKKASAATAEKPAAKKTRTRRKKKSAEPGKTSEELAADEEARRTQVILVNAIDREERRVAVVGEGRIIDLLMTSESQKTLVNDIYRGRVVNLEPAIGAAFVDFGQGRNGFLHTSDVLSIYGEDGFTLEHLLTSKVEPEDWDGDSAQSSRRVDIAEDEESGGKEGAAAKSSGGKRGRKQRRPRGRDRLPISDLIRVGDQVVVQVTKDAIGDKGPTLTTYISIPGRYLVLMPSLTRTGVSRKIPDDKERRRLKRILGSLNAPPDMGVIVRTAGVGKTKTDLQRDLDYLLGVWATFGKRLRHGRGPVPLYQESNVAVRTLRDLFGAETREVSIDDPMVHEELLEFAGKLMPDHVDRIRLHEGERPIFHHHGIEQDFEKVFARRVDLPSGGSIVFDQAEALVAIDVNSGRTRTDSFDFEEIALKTNLEAVPEIARQIRLRDLGGILVCDFIDMTKPSSNRTVERALRAELAEDRARSKLGRVSQFGLLEMTRQRLGPGTHKKVFQACPRCRGTGKVRTVQSRAQAILRRLGSALTQKGFTAVELKAHPEVIDYLREDLWDYVRALEHRFEKEIRMTAVPDQVEDSVLRYLRADGREVRPGGRRKR